MSRRFRRPCASVMESRIEIIYKCFPKGLVFDVSGLSKKLTYIRDNGDTHPGTRLSES